MDSISRESLRPIPDGRAAVDRQVFSTGLVAVGAFRCAPTHPLFRETGPIVNHCVVFPRTSAEISPSGFRSFIGDRTVVSVYNAGQAYSRRAISPQGDFCDYFDVEADTLRDLVAALDPAAADRPNTFTVSHVPGHPSWYLRQRRLFRAASDPATGIDTLELEERVLALVEDVARVMAKVSSLAHRDTGAHAGARRRQDVADAARELLARRATEPLTLQAIARAIGVSVFHLCRAFREVTGTTMHRYRDQLRLTQTLEWIDAGTDLSAVALAAGYSSHSHFTAAFRRTFGVTPSAARRG
jgi:AraC-like DNA-binding protein